MHHHAALTVAATVVLLIVQGSLPVALSVSLPSIERVSAQRETDIGVLPPDVAVDAEATPLTLAALQGPSSSAEAIAQAQQLQAALAGDRIGTINNLFVAWSRQFNKFYKDLNEASTALDAFAKSVDMVVQQNLMADTRSWAGFNWYSATPRRNLKVTLMAQPAPKMSAPAPKMSAPAPKMSAPAPKGAASPSSTPKASSPAPKAGPAPKGVAAPSPKRARVCTPRQKRLHLCFSGAKLSKGQFHGASPNVSLPPPSAVDWVKLGKTTPVKLQGGCSSCWVHSAITTIESALLIMYRKTVLLSRQAIVDCANGANGPDYDANDGCYMGDAGSAIMYASQFTVPYESDYPYTSLQTEATGVCNATSMQLPWSYQNYVQGFQVNYYQAYSEVLLQAAVAVQPVIIYWNLGDNFFSYSTNIYSVDDQNDLSSGCFNDPGTTNHAMVVVGYNATSTSHPYWIIQNSWGPSWGLKGLANVEFTHDTNGPCGMYGYVVAPVMAFKHVPPSIKQVSLKGLSWKGAGSPISTFSGGKTCATSTICSLPAAARPSGTYCCQISSVAVSPDTLMIAAGVWDATVRLYKVVGRQEIITFSGSTGHKDAVKCISFSADGTILASASADGTVKLWDALKRTPLFTLLGHTAAVNALAFSPDGETLASVSDDNSIKLWNVTSDNNNTLLLLPNNYATLLRGHTRPITTVTFSQDSQYMLTGSADYNICLWNRTDTTYEKVGCTLAHYGTVSSVTISPNGKLMASAGADHVVKIWNMTTFGRAPALGYLQGGNSATNSNYTLSFNGRVAYTNTTHFSTIRTISFSPDGQSLVSGGDLPDNSIRVFNVASFKQTARLTEGISDSVTSVAYSTDGYTIAASTLTGQIRFFSLQS